MEGWCGVPHGLLWGHSCVPLVPICVRNQCFSVWHHGSAHHTRSPHTPGTVLAPYVNPCTLSYKKPRFLIEPPGKKMLRTGQAECTLPGDRRMRQKACAWESVKRVFHPRHTVLRPPFPVAGAAPREGSEPSAPGVPAPRASCRGRKGYSLRFRAPARGPVGRGWDRSGRQLLGTSWERPVGSQLHRCSRIAPCSTARGPEDCPAGGNRGPVSWRKHTGFCLQQEGLSSCDVLVQQLSPFPLPPSLAGGPASRVSEGGCALPGETAPSAGRGYPSQLPPVSFWPKRFGTATVSFKGG